MKTIAVDLWGGQVRADAKNTATQYRHAEPAGSVGPTRSIESLFVGAYARFAATCRLVDEPGVAIIAVDEDTGRADGMALLRARIDRHVATIVGRHDRCDLFLPRPALALRHFVVIVDPVRSFARGEHAGYRVFDLRTESGMHDEDGRELRGLRADGPAILRAGGYVMFLLPLGDPTDWPMTARDAWACLPQRVYCDELEQRPEGTFVQPPRQALGSVRDERGDRETSVVSRTRGPWDSSVRMPALGRPDRFLAEGSERRRDAPEDEHAGTLEIAGPAGAGRLEIGRRALGDGVLLGRYARCDGAGLGGDGSLSRVHALVVQLGERVIVVDTASRNGSRPAGEDRDRRDARVLELRDRDELELGFRTRIRWRWSS